MKAMILSTNNVAVDSICEYLRSIGGEIITYKWLLKAMDNIDEVAPHLLIIYVDDFPRSWKTFCQYALSQNACHDTSIILVTSAPLASSEQNKADALGVSFVVGTQITEAEKKSIYNFLTNKGFVPERFSQKLLFKHPIDYTLVKGQIISMFSSIIIFHPENNLQTATIKAGTLIKSCTLRIGNALMEPVLKVIQNNATELQLQIISSQE